MILDTTLLITDIVLVLILFSIIFKWAIKEIRDIVRDLEGLIKFTQVIFMLGSWSIFFLTFIYYLFFKNDELTLTLNIFLTIVVGFLGTMMGLFFSSEALNNLRKRYDHRGDRLLTLRKSLKGIEESLRKLEDSKPDD